MSLSLLGNTQTTGQLSGNWSTTTVARASGDIVNKYYLDQQTGFLYPNYNPAAYSTSGNLYSSGANLFTNDTILSGNIISLSGDISRANLGNLVYTSGWQTITGLKTFNSGISVLYISGREYAYILDSSGVTAMTWDTDRILYNNLGDYSIDWGRHQLWATDTVPTYESSLNLDWKYKRLSGAWTAQNLNSFNYFLSGNNILNLLYSRNNPSGYITGLPGTGNFYRIENPNNYVSSGTTGNLTNFFVPRAESGQFYSIQNNNFYANSGNLAATGADLLSRHQLLSGNLISTGQTLLNSDSIISGNISSTGSSLQQQIFNTTKLSVTGSNSLSGLINFTGLGGLQVALSGANTVTFSGGAGGGTTNNNYYLSSGVTGISVSGGTAMTGFFNLNPGSNITLTQIGLTGVTIAAGGGMTWNSATSDITMVAGNGYICSGTTGLVNLLLPETASVGSEIKITSNATGGWQISQNAGNIINFGNVSTSVGTGGYLKFTHFRDSINMVCITANHQWNIINSVGNILIN